MKNILTAPWMVEMIRTVTNMYDHGWDERNGGNVSLLLEESQVNDYVDGAVLREIPTGFSCPELDGKYFLVTGTGKYFKNVQYTRTLWQMCTECIVVFPDGVNVLPWMLCGTNEIGEATAEKMRTARLVVWAQHGIYGAGKDLDETFGLIETAEKAAEIYMKIAQLPLVNTITDDQMHQLEAHFGVKAREGYLS